MRELNVVMALAGRDLLKFFRDPGRTVAAVIFPFAMIFLLGGTLQLNLGKAAGFNFIGFTFTGFLGMTLFQSTAQGLTSLMDDRQNDFAQEMFVSPVSRYSIVVGKILGETTVAIMQVLPMVIFAAVLRVPLTPTALLLLVPVALLSCFMGGAFGLLLLNTMSDSRASNQIFNFVFLPQYFLAGLISPINNLPWYLEFASLASPMRYVIDLARGVVFAGSPDYKRGSARAAVRSVHDRRHHIIRSARNQPLVLRRPDPDGLDVGELLDPILGELAPVTRLLDPAERKAHVRGDHAVDEHQARLDTLGQLRASLDVGGPDARAKTEIGIVGHTERLFLIADANHRRDGAEGLLVVHRHARPHAHEHGRLEVVPIAADALPADERTRAEVYRFRHLTLQIGDE